MQATAQCGTRGRSAEGLAEGIEKPTCVRAGPQAQSRCWYGATGSEPVPVLWAVGGSVQVAAEGIGLC
jgi:hypothetical protein